MVLQRRRRKRKRARMQGRSDEKQCAAWSQ
jgi:hypothetical protein